MKTQKVKDGGPAFPSQEMQHNPGNRELWEGMSLRDYFAAKAMEGLLAIDQEDECTFNQIAVQAYKQADAMIKAREL